jgi:hypothetical protein
VLILAGMKGNNTQTPARPQRCDSLWQGCGEGREFLIYRHAQG